MSKVILEGYIDVPAADMAGVLNELPNHIQLSLSEDGCTVFEVTRDKQNPNRLNVYEEFKHAEAFKFHQNRVEKSRWGEISKNATRQYSVKSPAQNNLPLLTPK